MKLRYIPVLLFICMQSMQGQIVLEAAKFEFPSLFPLTDVTYRARDYIDLNPGVTIEGNREHTFEIDPHMICDVDYLEGDEIIDGSKRELNLNLPVGATAGIFNVSNTGAANYSIPIQLPPGTEGMAPKISINYNSQSGNGLLGIGWNLSGISVITRTGSTLLHDSKILAVKLNNEDHFVLDGQRLLAVSGTYGNSDAVYHTEIETYSEITTHGSIGDGPTYFKVKTKDGKTLYYGYDANSRQVPTGSTVVLTWFLKRIEDRMGNYMLYNYEKRSNGETYIKSIDYTGNSNINSAPYNKVVFFYEQKSDAVDQYVSGKTLTNSLILSSIKTYHEDELVKKYKFKYIDDFCSHLNTIEEYDSEGNHFNSTVVGWGEVSSEFREYTINDLADTEGYKIFFGDFNGDGRKDILKCGSYYDNDKKCTVYDRWEIFTSTGKYFQSEANGYIYNTCHYVLVADIDGDGIDEIHFKRYDRLGYVKTIYTTFRVNQSTFNLGLTQYGFEVNNFGNNEYFGDVNGDGVNEMFFKTSIDIPKDFFSNEITSFESYSLVFFSNDFGSGAVTLSNFERTETYLFDFNGDGRMNPVFVTDNSDGECFQVIGINDEGQFDVIYTGGFPSIWHNNYFGDFNGDRITDVLSFYDNTSGSWSLHYGTGVGWKWGDDPSLPDLPDVDMEVLHPSDKIRISDLNGDGKQDILHLAFVRSGGNSFVDYHANYSNGNGFVKKSKRTSFVQGVDAYISFNKFLEPIDITGDGKAESIFSRHINSPLDVIQFRPDEDMNLVKQIHNGLGKEVNFYYTTLAKGRYYTRDNSEINYPEVIHFNGPLSVVSDITTNNGVSGISISSYRYTGAKIHRYGRGFLGFSEIEVSNNFSEIISRTTYEYDPEYFIVSPATSITETRKDQSDLISSTIYHNRVSETSYGTIFPYAQIVENIDHVSKVYSKTESVYDVSGNLTSIVTEVRDGITESSPLVETTTSNNTYTFAGNWFIKDAVDYTTITKSRPGMTDYKRRVDYSYYSTSGQLRRKVLDPGNAKALTIDYGYNNFGNITSVYKYANGLEPRIITNTYDNKGRFPIEKTDVLGNSTFKQYDGRFGVILETKDILNNTIKFIYDGFGRLTRSDSPISTSTVTNNWYDGNDIPNAVLIVTEQQSGSSDVVRYVDIMGRTVRQISTNFNGDAMLIDTEYLRDKGGKVKRVSEPYLTGTSPDSWYTYTYDDPYYRLSNKTGKALDVSYNYSDTERSVQTINNLSGQVSLQALNALGEAIHTEDEGGSVSMEYFSSGLTSTITAADGVISMIYDLQGNQISLEDPDAGITRYNYNAFGELIRQEDAKFDRLDMSYDILGRIESITEYQGSTTDYNYYESGNGNTQLHELTKNGVTYSYAYDVLGRVQSENELIDGQAYTYSYNYDNLGRLNQIDYPGGFSVTQHYNEYGYLEEVKHEGSRIWKLLETTDKGQIKDINWGNGLHTYKKYNEYDILNNISVTRTSYGNVMNLDYNFDETTGNLLSREDIIYNQFEIFTYDDVNRLTEWKPNDLMSFNIEYSQNGNIREKTDAGEGEYQYNSGRPHAVTGIVNGTDAISTSQQNIHYTNFNKIDYITENEHRLDFEYGPGNSRKKMEYTKSGVLERTKYYIGGGYEIEINHLSGETRHWYYIGAPTGLIVQEKIGSSEEIYYIHADHLGSPYAVTDKVGAVVSRYSFDPWGRQRNPYDWTDYETTEELMFARGFTGHEHLDEFALIHMNGRIYDPVLGRMLSPDNYISLPFFSQNYNRYSYALNNPLVITDPDGNNPFFLFLAGMALWSGGKVLQTEAMYGNIAPGWGMVGGGMQFAGGILMSAAMPNPIGVGAMGFSCTIMSGGTTQDALKVGAIALAVSGALEYGPAILSKIGELRLFDAPNGIKEDLASTLRRHFDMDFNLSTPSEFQLAFIRGSGSVISQLSGFAANGGAVNMKYLGEGYNRGVKSSQYNKYKSRVIDGTAPKWMQDVEKKWGKAYNMQLWPEGQCNEIIDCYKTHYLGENAYNVNIEMAAFVQKDLNIGLSWDGFDGCYDPGNFIDISRQGLNINKISHDVLGIIKCGKNWQATFSNFTIDYQIPIR